MDDTVKQLFLQNIYNYNDYDDYRQWMGVINNVSADKVPTVITPINLITGYCEDFAVYFAHKYNLDVYDLEDRHCLLFVDGIYYDGFNNKGVTNLLDLQFVKLMQEHEWGTITDESVLRGLISVYVPWKTYALFTNNFKYIDVVDSV